MKKLLFILCLLFIGCNNKPIEVSPEKSDEITTLQIQNIAKADTSMYHVVYVNDKLYVLNREYKVQQK